MSVHLMEEEGFADLASGERKSNCLLKIIHHVCVVAIVYELKQNVFEMLECREDFKDYFIGVKSFDEFILRYITLIQEDWKEKYRKKLDFQNIENEIMKKKELYFEYLQKEKNETYSWFSTRIFPNEWTDEKREIIVIIAPEKSRKMNVQKELVMREALRLAEKANKAKTEFLSHMSHDIRTPLNAVIGMTTIAKIYAGNREKVEECLEKITVSSKYILALINNILDMSKIESGKMTLNFSPFSIQKVVGDIKTVISPQIEEKKQKLQIHISDDIKEYYVGDVIRTKQILMNIIGNAIKFTPSGGTIYFSVISTKIGMKKDTIRFEIKDTGIGMSEELVKHVFEPFVQEMDRSEIVVEGTGLGLPITKNLVYLLNGKISVESQLGKGSTFIIELPFEQIKIGEEKKSGHSKSSKKVKPEFPKELRILIAEDNDINLEIITTLLEMNGFIVESANNGKEVLEKFKDSIPGYYCLIFMDVKMPVMDGLEATKRIRQLDKKDAKTVPIIAMTANVFKEDMCEAEEAGMNDYLIKPLDMELVLEKIAKSLGIDE